MCGIAGRLNFASGAPVAPAMVRAMCDLIAHRGPDGDGVHCDGAGRPRPSPSGDHRPEPGRRASRCRRADGALVITFNGEIYNYLRAARRARGATGHRFRSRERHRGDPRRLPRVGRRLRRRGFDGHVRVRALGLPHGARLFVARDRLGKKPLHYWIDRDGLAFASEPKAFLADPGVHARARSARRCLALPDLPVRAEPAVGLQGRAASCRRRTR